MGLGWLRGGEASVAAEAGTVAVVVVGTTEAAEGAGETTTTMEVVEVPWIRVEVSDGS